MHIDAKLNRLGFDAVLSAHRRLFLALSFGSFVSVSINHRASGVVNFAALDDPMLSFLGQTFSSASAQSIIVVRAYSL